MSNEIVLSGIVGEDITAAGVREMLSQVDSSKELVVRVHSEGGSVFEGFGIYDQFRAYEGRKVCVIESAAFSIMSFVVMAFDTVRISKNGYVMLHHPYTQASGNAEQLRRETELLAKLEQTMLDAYEQRTKLSRDEIAAMMQKETWLNARECLQLGFVDEIVAEARKPAALAKFDHMPHRVFASLYVASDRGDEREPDKEKLMSESQKPVAATVADIRAIFPKASDSFIVGCIEMQLPKAEVAEAAMEELMKQAEASQARVAELEAKLAEYEEKMRAAASAEAKVTPAQPEAVTKPVGQDPVAVSTSSGLTATQRWNALVDEKVRSGMTRARALAAVAKEHPSLRRVMIEEANQR